MRKAILITQDLLNRIRRRCITENITREQLYEKAIEKNLRENPKQSQVREGRLCQLSDFRKKESGLD